MTSEFWFVCGMRSGDRTGGIGGVPSSGEEGMNESSVRVGERFLGREGTNTRFLLDGGGL